MYELSCGSYLADSAGLVAFSAALLYAATGLRARLVPGWAGAAARLVEAVLWLALTIWVAEALGVVGALSRLSLLAGGLIVGLSVGALARRGTPGPERAPAAPAPDAVAVFVAAVAVAATVAAWAVPTAHSFAVGIDGADSTWYHLPQAARFAQTGAVHGLLFTDPYFFNWFYPANTELLHAVGMVAFDRDLLSPLVNAGFLGVGLLAAWCIGRPWGLGPHTTIAAGLVFASEMTLDFQAGEARADTAGLALFLAAIAVLVNCRDSRATGEAAPPALWSDRPGRRSLAVGGVAAGLAAGSTLSLLAPVAALSAGAVAIAAAGTRLRVVAVWLGGALAGGGFWYLRNLVHAGNPLPWIGHIGPLSLPSPERAIELRPQFSVSHYLLDGSVWSNWFLPGLDDGLGVLWPVLLAAVGIAVVLALLGGRRGRRGHAETRPFEGPAARAFGSGAPVRRRGTASMLAMLSVVVLAGLVAYALTPLTASGLQGAPIGFAWNLRYLGPVLALGLVLVPLVATLRRRPWRWLTLTGLAGLLAVQIVLLDVWDPGAYEGWALGAGLATLVAFAVAFLLGRRGRSRWPLPSSVPLVAAGLVASVAIAVGLPLQRSYLDRRYQTAFAAFELDRAVDWANGTRDAGIATAGRGGVFFQYGFYGAELSNRVQWVGVPGPNGAWLPASTCAEWKQAINRGDYDYVVTTFDDANPGTDATSTQREWVRRDEAAKEVLAEGPVAVYRLSGPLDPAVCTH